MGGRGAASKGIPSGWNQLETTYKSENGMVITEKGRINQANKSPNEMKKYLNEITLKTEVLSEEKEKIISFIYSKI